MVSYQTTCTYRADATTGGLGMPRERDRNRKMFHKGHYEVIAARFREQVSRYVNDEGEAVAAFASDATGVNCNATIAVALRDLAEELSARFAFDNEEHDSGIFMERCGFINVA
jgi:hypothetical protein